MFERLLKMKHCKHLGMFQKRNCRNKKDTGGMSSFYLSIFKVFVSSEGNVIVYQEDVI